MIIVGGRESYEATTTTTNATVSKALHYLRGAAHSFPGKGETSLDAFQTTLGKSLLACFACSGWWKKNIKVTAYVYLAKLRREKLGRVWWKKVLAHSSCLLTSKWEKSCVYMLKKYEHYFMTSPGERNLLFDLCLASEGMKSELLREFFIRFVEEEDGVLETTVSKSEGGRLRTRKNISGWQVKRCEGTRLHVVV